MADIFICYMLLSFMIHECPIEFCGVDVAYVRSYENSMKVWEYVRGRNWELWSGVMKKTVPYPLFLDGPSVMKEVTNIWIEVG